MATAFATHLANLANVLTISVAWQNILPSFGYPGPDLCVAGLVGGSRDPNKANRNKVRRIAKFGMIVYYKIVINNLI